MSAGCGVIPLSVFSFMISITSAAMSRKALSSRSLWPVRVSIRQPRLGHACTLLVFKVGNADRANVPPPTQELLKEDDVEKNRRRIV